MGPERSAPVHPTSTGEGPPARRYDVDWIRTGAIGLLIASHIAILFQPWAALICFPQSEVPLDALAGPMALEAGLPDPTDYSLNVDTLHGWVLGLICFLVGFLCASVQEAF